MEKNQEMIDEINRICEKYPDLKATKEYFEHLEDKEKNGSTINSMQIMYALVRIKEINKNEKILKRANVKEETKEQRRADMDKMSEQVEKSILNDRKRKKLKLADDMEPGTRFNANKEVIYEQLSKQIKYLQTVMKTAEKDRMKEVNKSKESDIEAGWVKESRIPASVWLKSCDRYVKGQMRKIQKDKAKESSDDGVSTVILNEENGEQNEQVESPIPEKEEKHEQTEQVESPVLEKEENREQTEQTKSSSSEKKQESDKVEERPKKEEKAESGKVEKEATNEKNDETVKDKEVSKPEVKAKYDKTKTQPDTKKEKVEAVKSPTQEKRQGPAKTEETDKSQQTDKIEQTDKTEPAGETKHVKQEPKQEQDKTSQRQLPKQETYENTISESMQQLDDWASQVVTKVNKGEKIEEILKENTTDSIIEKIKKGDININDVKKIINNKSVKETGKIDEKLVNTIAKYMIQRTNIIDKHVISNDDIIITVSSKDLIKKPTLWERIKTFFRGTVSKIKGFFTRKKNKKIEKNESESSSSTTVKNNRDEFRKSIFVDTKNVQIKTSNGKYVATKYTIIGPQENNNEKNILDEETKKVGHEKVD